MAEIKTSEQIEKIRKSGKILAKVLKELTIGAEEGVTLKDLDELAYGLIVKAGAKPAFLGYKPSGASKPYPASVCVSLNEVVVHGVPTNRRLRPGDLLKLDLGVEYQGFNSDSAVTLGIGEISSTAKKLIGITRDALRAAIYASRPGNTLGDIGHAVQTTVTNGGFSVVKGLTGHGIGEQIHEEPIVFNEGISGKGQILKPGMVLAIEPMVSAGSKNIIQLKDESYATIDSSLSAHFEHTVVITETGSEILTML